MDVEILSRIQFAFTIAFHYIYPPLSIGLGVVLVISSAMWLKTRKAVYHNMARYWTRVFGLTFAIGVATGIVMEFEFGTNWATYSRFVGDVFGSPLAIEGLYAFFLESGFLAILLFGWDKVGPKTHFFATCMVALGAHFSAIWIIVANSFMQTPAGYHLAQTVLGPDGKPLRDETGRIVEVPIDSTYIFQEEHLRTVRAVIDNFWDMVFSPSSMDRIAHTVIGCWLAGAFLVISIAAYYLLKKRHTEFARTSMKVGLLVAVVAACLQMISADSTARGVGDNQPTKLAAIEGLADTTTHAPFSIIGWASWVRDEDGNKIGVKEQGLSIPGLLSILMSGDFLHPEKALQTEVKGLNELPSDAFLRQRYPDATTEELAKIRPQYWPQVPAVYQLYRLMIYMGMAILFVAVVGCILWKTGKLWDVDNKYVRAFLWLAVFSVFFPQIANQAGWFTAEMGRQPWVVYEILRTSDGLSKAVKAGQVLYSLILFSIVYLLLFMVFIYTLHRKIKHGPRDDESIEILPERWRKAISMKGGSMLDTGNSADTQPQDDGNPQDGGQPTDARNPKGDSNPKGDGQPKGDGN